jgi:subtilase family serine protease
MLVRRDVARRDVALAKQVGRRARPLVLVAALLVALVAISPALTGGWWHALSLVPFGAAADAPAPTRGHLIDGAYLFTPDELRAAYGVTPLQRQDHTGAGQTVVVIECFGNPDLQEDLRVFDERYGLPPVDVVQAAPLGTAPFDEHDPLMASWTRETSLDVEIIHAIAPGARIVVLTSPVAENQGTSGLPEFLQLEQYAVDRQIGAIISQSWGASEVTLADAAGRAEVARWDAFFRRATQERGITFFASSGDHGATDYGDTAMKRMASAPTVSFPASDPWVTSVGGSSLVRTGDTFAETGWSGSGGGASAFFARPEYQASLALHASSLATGTRGVPDVSASADRASGLGYYARGEWRAGWGTSASAPLWAGLAAIANQMAGRPLGFLNPALYHLADSSTYRQDFHDLSAGNNTFIGWGVVVLGYEAAPGWDPVTGLGTPNAATLLPDLIRAVEHPGASGGK